MSAFRPAKLEWSGLNPPSINSPCIVALTEHHPGRIRALIDRPQEINLRRSLLLTCLISLALLMTTGCSKRSKAIADHEQACRTRAGVTVYDSKEWKIFVRKHQSLDYKRIYESKPQGMMSIFMVNEYQVHPGPTPSTDYPFDIEYYVPKIYDIWIITQSG
jgi:uncharacterized protein YceK